MKHTENIWGWMLAVDFFFAGMGGAMLLIAGTVDMFAGPDRISILGRFLAPAAIAIGASFLILELGRPLQAWRVFMNPKAILTIGAWAMLAAIGLGLGLAALALPGLPWSGWTGLQAVLTPVCALLGLTVATYPGILLGRDKSRPFWTGPGIMVLFLISSLVTGAAAHLLCSWILPPAGGAGLVGLARLTAGLLAGQMLIWPVYLWMKRSGATDREALAAGRWISGGFARAFWIGVMLLGTALPLVLVLLPNETAWAGGAALVLVGGVWMRTLAVRSGEDRTWLPGEEDYRSRLPSGDEAFLKAWKTK